MVSGRCSPSASLFPLALDPTHSYCVVPFTQLQFVGVTYIAVEPEDASQDCSPIALVAVLKHRRALSLP